MAVSKGYPENYEKGKVITGIQKDALVFTRTSLKSGQLKTSGGRFYQLLHLDQTIKKL